MFISIIFKKLTRVSAALPTQGKTVEKSLECAQHSMTFTQFLVKLWRTIFSWDCVTWSCLSSRERGREYSNSSFIKNVEERRVKCLSFINSLSRLLYDTSGNHTSGNCTSENCASGIYPHYPKFTIRSAHFGTSMSETSSASFAAAPLHQLLQQCAKKCIGLYGNRCTMVVGTLYHQNSQMRHQNVSCPNIFCLRCRRCPIIQCIFAHIVATTAAINFIHWCNGAAQSHYK